MLVELTTATALWICSSPGPGLVADAKPLRSVVYRVSYSRREELTIEHFGGGAPGAANPGGQITRTSDDGTITIDVYTVVNNDVIALVTEHWNSQSSSSAFKGAVTPDGSLIEYPPQISAASRTLLPLFASQFTSGTDLSQVGARWVIDASPPDYQIKTTYAVKAVNGDVVTLTETRNAKAKSPNAMDTVVTGTLAYKPRVLAPLSGDLVERATRSDAGSTDEIETNLHFERLSDTLDKAGG